MVMAYRPAQNLRHSASKFGRDPSSHKIVYVGILVTRTHLLLNLLFQYEYSSVWNQKHFRQTHMHI